MVFMHLNLTLLAQCDAKCNLLILDNDKIDSLDMDFAIQECEKMDTCRLCTGFLTVMAQ
jgi:hypothetical protein